jgi:hypothetical protein
MRTARKGRRGRRSTGRGRACAAQPMHIGRGANALTRSRCAEAYLLATTPTTGAHRRVGLLGSAHRGGLGPPGHRLSPGWGDANAAQSTVPVSRVIAKVTHGWKGGSGNGAYYESRTRRAPGNRGTSTRLPYPRRRASSLPDRPPRQTPTGPGEIAPAWAPAPPRHRPSPAFEFRERAEPYTMCQFDVCTIAVTLAGLPAL